MKRFCRLLPIVFVCLIAASCSLFVSVETGSVSICLPYYSSDGRVVTSPEGESYSFEIKVTDVTGYTHSQSANSGDEVVFQGIPLGEAEVKVLARDSRNIPLVKGVTKIDVTSGENEAEVSMDHAITVTLILNNKGTEVYSNQIETSVLSLDAFTEADQNSPSKMGVAWWYKDNINDKIDFSDDDALLAFLTGIDDDVVLNARLGVHLSLLENYLASGDVSPGEYIYVLNGSIQSNQLPQYSTFNNNATNLTLDFSECISLTSMNSSGFSGTAASRIATVIFPATITEIRGIKAFTGDIYIPMPATSLSFTNNVSYGSSDGSTSTYNIHFGGTLADWCTLVTLSNSTDSHPFTGTGEFWVLDSEGEEYKASEGSITVEAVNSKGTAVTTINRCSFQALECSEIKFPESVTTFGNSVFEYCTELTDIWLPYNGVCSIYQDTIKNMSKPVTIHVPASKVSAYPEAAYWGNLSASISFEAIAE